MRQALRQNNLPKSSQGNEPVHKRRRADVKIGITRRAVDAQNNRLYTTGVHTAYA